MINFIQDKWAFFGAELKSIQINSKQSSMERYHKHPCLGFVNFRNNHWNLYYYKEESLNFVCSLDYKSNEDDENFFIRVVGLIFARKVEQRVNCVPSHQQSDSFSCGFLVIWNILCLGYYERILHCNDLSLFRKLVVVCYRDKKIISKEDICKFIENDARENLLQPNRLQCSHFIVFFKNFIGFSALT